MVQRLIGEGQEGAAEPACDEGWASTLLAAQITCTGRALTGARGKGSKLGGARARASINAQWRKDPHVQQKAALHIWN